MTSSIPSLDNPSSIQEVEASPLEFIEGSLDGQPVLITDADLLSQVQSGPKNMRAMMIRMAARTQAERNKIRERREGMTPIQRRRDVVRERISENPIEKEDIHHIHSGLALCALPYKKLPDDVRDYERQYGRMTLNLEAGKLLNPEDGKMVRQGLPYGAKARLIQLHICTAAIRQKSPIVEIESSMTEFIRSLGFDVTGGKFGTIALFKEQLNRLAATRMQIALWDGKGRAKTINLSPIESFEVWFPSNPDQKMLWPSRVTLSDKFYESLSQHALPVNAVALSALKNSARQMDMLMWLGYRLSGLKEPYFLTWDVLKKQFCQSEERRMILFQKQFRDDLKDIQVLFGGDERGIKGLPVSLNDAGIKLNPCPPELLLVPPKKLLNK